MKSQHTTFIRKVLFSCFVLIPVGLATFLMAAAASPNHHRTTMSAEQRATWDDVSRLDNEGRLALTKGDNVAAEKAFRLAIAAKPSFRLSWYGLAQSLEGQHKSQEALLAYREALTPRADNGSTLEQNSDILRHYGALAERLGQHQEATVAFQRAVLAKRGSSSPL